MKIILSFLAISMYSPVAMADLHFNGPAAPQPKAPITCNESEIQPLLNRASAVASSAVSCQNKHGQLASLTALDDKISAYYMPCTGSNHTVVGDAADSIESRIQLILNICN